MAIRNIRQEGDEILNKKSKEVEKIDEKIIELMDDMVETMHKFDGVGLAAVQVGILKRIIVIDIYDEKTPILKLVNPKIIKQKGERLVEEGCLSFPNKFAKVKRPVSVEVEALNEKGKKIKIKATELLAQALCHEIDHLNGITFVEIMEKGSLQVVTNNNEKEES